MHRSARHLLAIASAASLLAPVLAHASGGNRSTYVTGIHMTADNAYQIFTGTSTGAGLTALGPAVNNVSNADIHSCTASGVENYPNETLNVSDYLYVVAMNDGSVTQGLLGYLDAGIYTNGAGWQVFDTGVVGSPSSFPNVATIQGYITAAISNSGNGAGSRGWVDVNGQVNPAGPGAAGCLYVGQSGSASSPDALPPMTCTSGPNGIPVLSHWIWYSPTFPAASSANVTTNTPGHGTNIMIFRLVPQNVPAASPLSLVIMSLLLAGSCVWLLRRRTQQTA